MEYAANLFPDKCGRNYSGGNFDVGVGAKISPEIGLPAEGHGGISYSGFGWQFNMFSALNAAGRQVGNAAHSMVRSAYAF